MVHDAKVYNPAIQVFWTIFRTHVIAKKETAAVNLIANADAAISMNAVPEKDLKTMALVAAMRAVMLWTKNATKFNGGIDGV